MRRESRAHTVPAPPFILEPDCAAALPYYVTVGVHRYEAQCPPAPLWAMLAPWLEPDGATLRVPASMSQACARAHVVSTFLASSLGREANLAIANGFTTGGVSREDILKWSGEAAGVWWPAVQLIMINQAPTGDTATP
jgi:hypothetical protein